VRSTGRSVKPESGLTKESRLVKRIGTVRHDDARRNRILRTQQAVGDLRKSELNSRVLVVSISSSARRTIRLESTLTI
jgi:hypothetical protein